MKVSKYNNSTVFLQPFCDNIDNKFLLQILTNVNQVYIAVLPILYASIQEAALSVNVCLDSLEME